VRDDTAIKKYGEIYHPTFSSGYITSIDVARECGKRKLLKWVK